MDALREYLENLFRGVKNTPEVYKAKAELLQMMEDKYDGLIAEGKSEDEAVGKIISEFGSFDEIVKELKIEDAIETLNQDEVNAADLNNNTNNNINNNLARKTYRDHVKWGVSEVNEYIKYAPRHALMIALGVIMCIISTYMASISDDIFSYFGMPYVADVFSTLMLFVCVGVGVILFILAHRMSRQYKGIDKDAIELDDEAADVLKKKNESAGGRTAALVAGIFLCCIAPATSALGDLIPGGLFSSIFDSNILLIAGVGVGLIVYSCSVTNRFKELSKGVRRFYNAAELSDGVEVERWTYRPKSSVPTAVIVIIAIILVVGVWSTLALLIGVRSYVLLPHSSSEGPTVITEAGRGITVAGDGEESFSSDEIDHIVMEVSVGQVVIEPIDEDRVVCEYHGEFGGGLMIDDSDGGTLAISMPRFRLIGTKGDGVIKLRVPREKLISYSMDVAVGDVSIHNMYADSLDIDMAAGALSVSDSVIAGNADIDLAAGNAEFTNTDVVELDVDCAAGNFLFHFADKSNIDRYDYDLSAGLGKVSIAGNQSGNEVERGARANKIGEIEVEAAMGNITID